MTDELSFPVKQITFSLGRPTNLAKSKNIKESIPKFAARFKTPIITPEKFHVYKKASDSEQRRLKAMNGWFIRCPIDGGVRNRNSVMPSDLITLDMDYCTPGFIKRLISGGVLPGIALIAHSSRSSTPESPRVRIIIFLKHKLNAERYQAASRIIAQKLDANMEMVDKVSFRPAQMMYMPTISKDMEQHYVYHEQGGELLDWEAEIELWEKANGSSTDFANLPRAEGEDELREAAEKAEDPLTKTGPVGDFCRAWTITELVMGRDGEPGPLAEFYEPVEWANGAISRMTYLLGSTSNGAVVYDDKFVFSHHGSDPTQETLSNAYDLFRIHKFGHLDEKADSDTPPSKMPSAVAMKNWLREDPHFREQQAESRYDLTAKFTDDDVAGFDQDEDEDEEDEEDEDEGRSADDLLGVPLSSLSFSPASRRLRVEKPPTRWLAKEVELTDDGFIKATLPNITTIISNDPRLWRKIGYNKFSRQIVLLAPIKSKHKLIPNIDCRDTVNGDRWQDVFDMTIRAIIECPSGQGKAGYGLKVGKELVSDAIRLAAENNAFHPILDYYDSLTGEPDRELVETFWIRHSGVEDNIFTREATLLAGVASVARMEEPGHKWDHAIIFEGKQGTGKSTSIKRLYGGEYFGELHADLKDDKKCAEAMMGKAVMELPELSSLHKSDHNDAKAFITRQHDDVRLSYDRHVAYLPRQCIFYGTSNDKEYLRDPTGNRRFWPFVCDGRFIDILGILNERDTFWRTCHLIYKEMRQRQPQGELKFTLSPEAEKIAFGVQESRRKAEMWESWHEALMDWMDEPITLRQHLIEMGKDEFDLEHDGLPVETTMVERVAFSQLDAYQSVIGSFGNLPSNNIADLTWKKVLAKLEEDMWSHARCRIGGVQRRWHIRPDTTQPESLAGYRVVLSPDGTDDADSPVDHGGLL